MRYNTKGIILGKRNFRDSDSFFSVYTLKKGKVEAIARGARKVKSKLGGHLDYFSVIDLMIAEGKKFNHIGGALLENNFQKIKKDFQKINLGFYCLEITDHFIQNEKTDKNIFFLLKDYLHILNKNKLEYKLNLFLSYVYILKLLVYLGYRPELESCVKCKNKIDTNKENYFNVHSGGVVCGSCFSGKSDKNNFKIGNDLLNIIIKIIKQDLKEIDIKNRENSGFIKIIDLFLIYRLDREIKSRRFLVKSSD